MATRGRKPKPTALKMLEGNPGNRPLNKNEPQPAQTETAFVMNFTPKQRKF